MVERHGAEVPDTPRELVALPGVGTYTAAAVSAFAFGRRVSVVDTNVRRVLARLVTGVAQAAPCLTRAEVDLATALLPEGAAAARAWNAAVMEVGALVCSARTPRCPDCPVSLRRKPQLAPHDDHLYSERDCDGAHSDDPGALNVLALPVAAPPATAAPRVSGFVVTPTVLVRSGRALEVDRPPP